MPRGIPHSTFLGWDPDDQDKALEWVALERRTCSGCGTRPDEWDPALGGDRDAYRAEPRRCAGCEELARAQRQLAAQHDEDELHGVRLALIRNDDEDGEG